MNPMIAGKFPNGPITPDGMTGFDSYGQLMTWRPSEWGDSVVGHHISDVRSKTCCICQRGWENTSKSLADQIVFGDEKYAHATCYDGHLALVELMTLKSAVIAADFLAKMEEVPARYPRSTPWQRMIILKNDHARSASDFKIVMGRRKRVWDIHMHAPQKFLEALEAKIADYPETHGRSESSDNEPEFGPYVYMHAWTEDQLISNLKLFQSVLPDDVKRSEIST